MDLQYQSPWTNWRNVMTQTVSPLSAKINVFWALKELRNINHTHCMSVHRKWHPLLWSFISINANQFGKRHSSLRCNSRRVLQSFTRTLFWSHIGNFLCRLNRKLNLLSQFAGHVFLIWFMSWEKVPLVAEERQKRHSAEILYWLLRVVNNKQSRTT